MYTASYYWYWGGGGARGGDPKGPKGAFKAQL